MKMTIHIARAAAQDAANKQMRMAGRKAWNEDDFNIAAETFASLAALCK